MCNLDAGLVARLSQLISCPQIANLIIQLCNNANNKNRNESENINEKRGVKNGNATILAFEKKRRKSSVKKKKSVHSSIVTMQNLLPLINHLLLMLNLTHNHMRLPFHFIKKPNLLPPTTRQTSTLIQAPTRTPLRRGRRRTLALVEERTMSFRT